MAKIKKLNDKGELIYPATILEAVKDPSTKENLREIINKGTTEYNVSVQHPTGGIGGTNKYTLETAIQKIPVAYRNVGIKCSFLGESGAMEAWQYRAGGWNNLSSWLDITMVRSYPFLREGSSLYNFPVGGICEFGSVTDGYDNEQQPLRLFFAKIKGVVYVQILRGEGDSDVIASYQSEQNEGGIKEITLTNSVGTPKFRAIVNLDLAPPRAYSMGANIVNPRIRYKATINDMKSLHNAWMSNVLFKDGAKVADLPLNCITDIYSSDKDLSGENLYFEYIRAVKNSTDSNYTVLIRVINDAGENLCQYYNTSESIEVVKSLHLYKVARYNADYDIYVRVKLDGVTHPVAYTKEYPIIVRYEHPVSGAGVDWGDYIFQSNRYAGLDGNKFVKNGFILNIWKDYDPENSNNIICEKTLFSNIPNEAYGAIVQFKDKSGDIYQSFFSTKDTLRKGIEVLTVKNDLTRKFFYMMVDWDKIAGERFYGVDDVTIDTSNIPLVNNSGVFEKIQQEVVFDGKLDPVSDVGVKVPQGFSDKMTRMEKDLEIVLVGDSLTGLTRGSGYIPVDHAAIMPPGFTTYHWHYWLWRYILRNYPDNLRIDKMKKTGEWKELIDGKLNDPNIWGEYSEASRTYQSNTEGASISFEWDFSKYEKTNIVFSKNPDGDALVISVAEGAGNVLVSENKQDWVEANGYILETNSNPENLSVDEIQAQCKILHSRHRRLWMKRQKNSGVVNVKVTKKSSDTAKYVYVWGIEKWNGNAVFITNLGRGGRNTRLLNLNIDDIADRNPDLVIYEMPLANDLGESIQTIKSNYSNYFFGVGNIKKSLKSISNSYSNMNVVVLCPHGRSADFTGNNNNQDAELGMPRYVAQKGIFNWLKNEVKDAGFENKISFLNLYDLLISEGRNRGWSIEQTLSEYYLTYDGIHLNATMSRLWAKYLVPLFY